MAAYFFTVARLRSLRLIQDVFAIRNGEFSGEVPIFNCLFPLPVGGAASVPISKTGKLTASPATNPGKQRCACPTIPRLNAARRAFNVSPCDFAWPQRLSIAEAGSRPGAG